MNHRLSHPVPSLFLDFRLTWLLFLILSSTYAALIDAVPAACTPACQSVTSSIETCQYLTCICDNDHGRNFQSCLTCLYQLFPTNETYDAAQGTLQNFETNCADKITVPLNITYISPSGTPSTTTPPSSSIVSISASRSTISASSNTTARSQTPTPTASNSTMISQSSRTVTSSSSSSKTSSAAKPTSSFLYHIQGAQQVCRLRVDATPRRYSVSSTPSAMASKQKPANIRAVLGFLAVLIFIPIGILIVRT